MKSIGVFDPVSGEASSAFNPAVPAASARTPLRQTSSPNTQNSWRNRIARIFAGKPVFALSKTESVFPMSAEQAWPSIAFYEELLSPLPFLLRLAVPEPLGVEGKKTGVGSEVYCVYRLGHLRKRVTQMDAPHTLRFEVLEQDLGIEDGLRASSGYYVLEPIPEGCRIQVGTHYESRMHPRWLWRPIEEILLHALHSHILENMKDSALRTLAAQKEDQGATR